MSNVAQYQVHCFAACALLHRPDILLLYEATSALDEEAEAALHRLLVERLPDTETLSMATASLAALHTRAMLLFASKAGEARLAGARSKPFEWPSEPPELTERTFLS